MHAEAFHKRFYLFAVGDILVNMYVICIICIHIHLSCGMSMHKHEKVSCIQTSHKGLLYKVLYDLLVGYGIKSVVKGRSDHQNFVPIVYQMIGLK